MQFHPEQHYVFHMFMFLLNIPNSKHFLYILMSLELSTIMTLKRGKKPKQKQTKQPEYKHPKKPVTPV